MSELIFSLELEKKEKDFFLLIHSRDKLLGPSRIVYADALQRGSKEDKDLYSFLLKQHLKSLGISPLSDKLPGLSIAKIRIPANFSQEAIKLLALAKKLNWKDKSVFYNPFAKVDVFFKAREIEGKLEVSGYLSVDGKESPFSSLDLLFPADPMWCIIDRTVLILPKEIDRKLILKAYPFPLLLEGKKKEQFIEENLDDEDVRIVWEIPQVVAEEKAPEPLQALPVLILQDTRGAFANLSMDYGSHGIVPFSIPTGSFRDFSLEKSWEKDLLETGFQKKIVGSSHYYCPLDQVTKTLSFLLDLGWKIIDGKGRQVFRYSSSNLQVCLVNEEIITRGKLSYEDHEVDLQNVVGAFNRRDRFVELSPYSVGLMDSIQIENDLGDLLDAENSKDGLKLKKHQAGLLDSLLEKKYCTLDVGSTSLVERMKHISSLEECKPSGAFQGTLYPYQQEGVNWLSFLYNGGLSGLLADDMGLGKTVQVLGFLSKIQTEKPLLIIAPTSLLFNWKREWERFLPSIEVYVHGGKERCNSKEELLQKKVILTSYSLFRIDFEVFTKVCYECAILDEAQSIKNPESQVASAAFKLQAKMRIAITGTPVENRWDDLWSLFHFLEPELLDERKEFHASMMAAQADDRYLKRVKKKIKPFLLRRTKEQVAIDLPEKVLQTVWVEMSPSQREIYERYLSKNRQGLLKEIENQGLSSKRMEVLEALLRLRQICCHPHLVEKSLDEGPDLSAKLERVLIDMQEVVQEGRKVILFSQFTGMLKIFERQIQGLDLKYVYLDGSTKDRESVIKTFQEDPSTQIFLMSLKAGGVGLNLTAADYVFLCDPWWNDAAERQAIDRAHRMGRKDVVVARRYVMAETVEEKIMKLKEKKSAIATGLIEMEAELSSFSMDDLLEMLK